MRGIFKNKIVLIVILIFGFCGLSQAELNDWAEGGYGQEDGATRDYYNLGGKLAWKNFMGDWIDASDFPQGLSPYSHAFIKDTDSIQMVEWNVTNLVKEWLTGTIQNHGLFLHVIAGKGSYNFRSREYTENKNQRPQLIIILDDGKIFSIEPEADTYLNPTTYKSLGGKSDFLSISSGSKGNNALIRFPLDSLSDRSIISAHLRLTTFAQYGNSNSLIGIFRCDQGTLYSAIAQNGIAENYYKDIGISKHEDVIFATGFEKKKWLKEWSSALYNYDTIDYDTERNFSPLSGRALRFWLVKGSHYGSGLKYKFQEKIGYEPEKIFFRYYLRLANNWNQAISGGKLPGFAGTYDKAGWGGRKPNGFDGWSARGTFLPTIQEKSNPLVGRTPIGTYCYNASQPTKYGEIWIWNQGKHGFPVPDKWYCIEQYLELNTPGEKNGIIMAWIDGYQVFEKTDILFRLSENLKIEHVLPNLYHGGKAVSPHDQHIYIDNVVIAKSYIGPMNVNCPESNPKCKEETEHSDSSFFSPFIEWCKSKVLEMQKK